MELQLQRRRKGNKDGSNNDVLGDWVPVVPTVAWHGGKLKTKEYDKEQEIQPEETKFLRLTLFFTATSPEYHVQHTC
jgi:hypothetical protein